MTSPSDARERFLAQLRRAVQEHTLVKLTLGKPRSPSDGPRNLFVRPVELKAGPRLCFVWRYATRDETKNHPPEAGLALLETLLGTEFIDAHLFTPAQTIQLTSSSEGAVRLSTKMAHTAPPAPLQHNRPKEHLIPADAPWLRALGVTNDRGQPREGMAAKFRQIQKFTELLAHWLVEAGLTPPADGLAPEPLASPLRIADMGCGKGYLTFALAAHLGPRAQLTGFERRPELVARCRDVATAQGWSHLDFVTGDIASAPLDRLDVLVALHACDTATDDALARGLAAQARLLVVSPCCQKELRPQLTPPPVLADALRHGIFQERHAEFATDALRALLLEWAGFRTYVCEFVSTEHTAKNLLLAALRTRPPGDDALAGRIRAFAAFYGIRRHRLAQYLEFSLTPS